MFWAVVICFSPWVLGARGGVGGSPKGLVRNLLFHFFTLGSSKFEVLQTYFFHVVITQNDHPRYVKHDLGRIYVFFTLFGYWVWGGGCLDVPLQFLPTTVDQID